MNVIECIKNITSKDDVLNKYDTIVEIENNDQYLFKLEEILNNFVAELFENCDDKKIVIEIEKYKSDIIEAMNLYYNGDLIKAQETVNNLIDSLKNSKYAISNINDSISFPQSHRGKNNEVQFFRARVADSVLEYSIDDMKHIPFDKREKVRPERFGILGLPCLYLSTTSYGCWIELGSPADYMLNVSPVRLDNTQKILNLTITLRDIKEFVEDNSKYSIDDMKTFLKIFLLNISTSFRINNPNRAFKSEYVLSQMIMLACKHIQLDGLTYLSKQVSNSIFARYVATNLVLFATYQKGQRYSPICDHIDIIPSFNYLMFKQLLPSLKCKDYDLRISESDKFTNIGNWSRNYPYNETEFFEFDKFLFCSLPKVKKN